MYIPEVLNVNWSNRMRTDSLVRAATFSAALLASAAAYAQAQPETAATSPAPEASAVPAQGGDHRLTGLAAVYSDRLNGRKTASGKRYDKTALTAAHPTLPFGTKVKITNEKNGKSVVVTINDRGPTQPDRVLDVSQAAAKKLGIGPKGMAPVTAEVVS
jgi:peptidoglycan lytic transglycosylase